MALSIPNSDNLTPNVTVNGLATEGTVSFMSGTPIQQLRGLIREADDWSANAKIRLIAWDQATGKWVAWSVP